jgi:hypothetical protein
MVHIIEKTKETIKGLVKNDPLVKKFSKESEEKNNEKDEI